MSAKVLEREGQGCPLSEQRREGLARELPPILNTHLSSLGLWLLGHLQSYSTLE